MKIVYLTNVRIPTSKAHGVYLMKICQALAQTGNEVALVSPQRHHTSFQSPFDYYKVNRIFKIEKVFCFDLAILQKLLGPLHFYLRSFFYSLLLIFNRSVRQADFIIVHDLASAFMLSLFKNNLFYEMHDYIRSKKPIFKFFLKKVKGIIVTNQWKKKRLIESWQIAENKIIALPNAIDPTEFVNLQDSQSIRNKFQIPADKIIFGYIGRFKTIGLAKGIDLVLSALKKAQSQNQNIYLVLAGGSQAETREYQDQLVKLELSDSVKLLPYVPYSQIADYYALPEIFLLPYPKNDHYNLYMSPMKLMEYVACHKPVISADLQSVKEIFSQSEICYFQPENENDLADKMLELADSSIKRREFADRAFEKIKDYTWLERARRIISFSQSFGG